MIGIKKYKVNKYYKIKLIFADLIGIKFIENTLKKLVF
jgi:hypothetical protein